MSRWPEKCGECLRKFQGGHWTCLDCKKVLCALCLNIHGWPRHDSVKITSPMPDPVDKGAK